MTTGTLPDTARRQQAEQRLLVIRNALEVADAELERAFVERDWETLEFDSWESYCAAIPEFTHFKMKVGPRRARAKLLREAGATIPEIVAATGSSLGTIHRDLNPAPSFQMETAPAEMPQAAPPVQSPKTDRVVALVAAQGAHGLTCLEVEHATGWRHGVASGPVSTVARQGRIRATGRFREGYGVYVTV